MDLRNAVPFCSLLITNEFFRVAVQQFFVVCFVSAIDNDVFVKLSHLSLSLLEPLIDSQSLDALAHTRKNTKT